MDEKDLKHLEEADAKPTEGLEPPSQYAVDISSVDKAKVLRKMDLRIIPVVTILYLFSFLDRGYVAPTCYRTTNLMLQTATSATLASWAWRRSSG